MNPEPYRFLFRVRGSPLVEEVIELREVISQLPETKASFRLSHHLNSNQARLLLNRTELLYLVGTWHLPPWFPGGTDSGKPRLVNPKYPHKERYSLAAGKCACGKIVSDFEKRNPITEPHGEGCTAQDRKSLMEDVFDIRFQRILIGAHLNQPAKVIAPSVGLAPRTVLWRVNEMGLDWRQLQNVGKHRMAVTIDRLSEEGYSYRQIGEVFGCSKDMIYDYSTRKVFNRRRANALA